MIDFGGHRLRWPWENVRLPSAGPTIAALVVGLALGFVVGRLQETPGSTAIPAPSSTATVLPSGDTSLTTTGDLCAIQLGRRLQLGAEVLNQSGRPLRLLRVTPVLPLGGLRPEASNWGTCGSLFERSTAAITLPAGATSWLAVTFRVLARCPQPLPVEFRVSFEQGGRLATARLDSFPDLGHVHYSKCGTLP